MNTDPAATSYALQLHEVITTFLCKRALDIEKVCLAAVARDCGVRIVNTVSGGYFVHLDEGIPPLTIHEYLSSGGLVVRGSDCFPS